MSICFLSGLVELLGVSQVPILISALMPPHPSTPHPAFRHSSAGKYSSARWSTLKWWMENVKHCTRLLLSLSYDVDWHHEDLSLWDFVVFSLLLLLSLHFYPPESSEFSLHLCWDLLFEEIVMTNTWKCDSGVSVNVKVWRLRGELYSYLRNKLCSKLDLWIWEGMDEWMMFQTTATWSD